MMSREHYIQVAHIISQTRDRVYEEEISGEYGAIREIEARLAVLFERDNPNFDADRFHKACKSS